jgi:hypothetical protein
MVAVLMQRGDIVKILLALGAQTEERCVKPPRPTRHSHETHKLQLFATIICMSWAYFATFAAHAGSLLRFCFPPLPDEETLQILRATHFESVCKFLQQSNVCA